MTTTGSSKIIWWCCLFLIGSFIINYCDCGALEKELKELADDEDENDLEATDILRSALCKQILFIFIHTYVHLVLKSFGTFTAADLVKKVTTFWAQV